MSRELPPPKAKVRGSNPLGRASLINGLCKVGQKRPNARLTNKDQVLACDRRRLRHRVGDQLAGWRGYVAGLQDPGPLTRLEQFCESRKLGRPERGRIVPVL